MALRDCLRGYLRVGQHHRAEPFEGLLQLDVVVLESFVLAAQVGLFKNASDSTFSNQGWFMTALEKTRCCYAYTT